MLENNKQEILEAIAPAFKRALAKRYPMTEKQKAVLEKAFADRMKMDNESEKDSDQKRERERQTKSQSKSQSQKHSP